MLMKKVNLVGSILLREAERYCNEGDLPDQSYSGTGRNMKYSLVKLSCIWLCVCWGGLVKSESESRLWNAVGWLGRFRRGRADWADLDRLPNFEDPNVLFDSFYRMDEAETTSRNTLSSIWKDAADFLETEYQFRRWVLKQSATNDSKTSCQDPEFCSVMQNRVKREGYSQGKPYDSYLGAIFYYFPILQFTIPFSGEVKLLGYDLL